MAGDVAMDSGGGDCDRPVIIDGLLCSILRAMSREGASAELASVIERCVSENEVKTAWEKLFTHFKDVIDPTRKKRVIEIVRESTKGRINDILTQLKKLDTENEDSELLLMPWNYIIKQFESESEVRSRIWEEEKSRDFDDKLTTLELKMDKKHNELLTAFRSMLSELDVGKKSDQITFTVPAPVNSQSSHPSHQSTKASYAGAAAQQVNREVHAHHVQAGGGQHLGVSHGVGRGWGRTSRSRSPSIKRFRNEDGSSTEIVQTAQSASKKGVVGTSNPAINGRKMKSPPAAIFVWGVHPETTTEDIVNDLAASDIFIEVKDIEKKSRDEAFLVSYKINIPADKLLKALDPEIWPLRVKVREFIYYKRKPQGRAQQGLAQQGPGGQGNVVRDQGRHHEQQSQAVQGIQVPSHTGYQDPGVVVGQHGQHHGQGGHLGGRSDQHVQFYQALQNSKQQQLYPNLSNMFGVLGAPGAPNPNL